jgi:hypothetical protein
MKTQAPFLGILLRLNTVQIEHCEATILATFQIGHSYPLYDNPAIARVQYLPHLWSPPEVFLSSETTGGFCALSQISIYLLHLLSRNSLISRLVAYQVIHLPFLGNTGTCTG